MLTSEEKYNPREEIERQLASAVKEKHLILLHGKSQSGKTTLLQHYLDDIDKNTKVIWVNCENLEGIKSSLLVTVEHFIRDMEDGAAKQSYQESYKHLTLKSQVSLLINLFNEWLNNLKNTEDTVRYLVVYDGLDDMGDLTLLDHANNICEFITSQLSAEDLSIDAEQIEMPPFQDELEKIQGAYLKRAEENLGKFQKILNPLKESARQRLDQLAWLGRHNIQPLLTHLDVNAREINLLKDQRFFTRGKNTTTMDEAVQYYLTHRPVKGALNDMLKLINEKIGWRRTQGTPKFPELVRVEAFIPPLKTVAHNTYTQLRTAAENQQAISLELLRHYVKVNNSIARYFNALGYYDETERLCLLAVELIDKSKVLDQWRATPKNPELQSLMRYYAEEILHNLGNAVLNQFSYDKSILARAGGYLARSFQLQRELNEIQAGVSEQTKWQSIYTALDGTRVFRDTAKAWLHEGHELARKGNETGKMEAFSKASEQLAKADEIFEELSASYPPEKKTLPLPLRNNITLYQAINKLFLAVATGPTDRNGIQLSAILKQFEQCRQILQTPGSKTRDLANVLLWLAEGHRIQGQLCSNTQQANEHYRKSESILIEAFNLTGLSHPFLYGLEPDYAGTDRFDFEALHTVRGTIGILSLARFLVNMAETQQLLKQYGAAYRYVSYAMAIQAEYYEPSDYHYQHTQRLKNELYRSLKKAKRPVTPREMEPDRNVMKRIQALESELRNTASMEGYGELALLHYQNHRFDAAFKHFKELASLNSSQSEQPMLTHEWALAFFDSGIILGKLEEVRHLMLDLSYESATIANINRALDAFVITEHAITTRDVDSQQNQFPSFKELYPRQKVFYLHFLFCMNAQAKKYKGKTKDEFTLQYIGAISGLFNIDIESNFGNVTLPLGEAIERVSQVKQEQLKQRREQKADTIETHLQALVEVLSRVAIVLAKEYELQLCDLNNRSIYKLTNYLAYKIIHQIAIGGLISEEVLTADTTDVNAESKKEQFFLQILSRQYVVDDKKYKKSSRFAKGKSTTKYWTLQGIVEQAGLSTLEGDHLVRTKKSHHDLYGFRQLQKPLQDLVNFYDKLSPESVDAVYRPLIP